MIQPQGDTMVWLAGLYRTEDGLPYFAVLTRKAADEIKFIHDMMPLIIPKDRIQDRLPPDNRPEVIFSRTLTDMVSEKAGNARKGSGSNWEAKLFNYPILFNYSFSALRGG